MNSDLDYQRLYARTTREQERELKATGSSGGKPLALASINAERFWKRVSMSAVDACWEWAGPRDSCGYGKMHSVLAHRVAWTLLVGSIPRGMVICHHCDNRVCCNTAHLFLGTQADNVRDMRAKRRGKGADGQRNSHARLTPRQVYEIRKKRLSDGSLVPDLAAEFGVHKSTINRVLALVADAGWVGVPYPGTPDGDAYERSML